MNADAIREMLLPEILLALRMGFALDTSANFASRRVIDEVLTHAASGERLNAHEYWNSDKHYFMDFNEMPTLPTCRRLKAAAKNVEEALGIRVELVDCSSGYAEHWPC